MIPDDPLLEGRILHLDDVLVVVDKPPGIATSGLTLDDSDCLQGRLMRWLGQMVWVCHQLDKPTSGVNVFARRKSEVARVRARMTGPGASKEYLAIVHGRPAFDERVIDVPIGFVDAEQRRLAAGVGKRAVTEVRVLARGPAHAALHARLLTGRTHQVRIHLAHVGHPLVGEGWYRDPPCDRLPRHALHALRLRLDGGEAPSELVAPLPADLRELARELGCDPSDVP